MGEGGEEEVDKGDAGEGGDDHGEQAKNHLHCSHLSSYPILFFWSWILIFYVLNQMLTMINQGAELVLTGFLTVTNLYFVLARAVNTGQSILISCFSSFSHVYSLCLFGPQCGDSHSALALPPRR